MVYVEVNVADEIKHKFRNAEPIMQVTLIGKLAQLHIISRIFTDRLICATKTKFFIKNVEMLLKIVRQCRRAMFVKAQCKAGSGFGFSVLILLVFNLVYNDGCRGRMKCCK